MFGLFRKKKQKKPAPWMTWAAVAFLIYAMLVNGDKKNTPPAQSAGEEKQHEKIEQSEQEIKKEIKPENPTTSKTLGEIIDPNKMFNMDLLKDKILPKAEISLQVENKEIGTGGIAFCGQEATINYTSFGEDDKEIEKRENVTFKIGEGKIMPAPERGVLGMNEGGVREIISPPYLAYGAEGFAGDEEHKNKNIRFTVKLIKTSPKIADYSAYRILGDVARGTFYTCGKEAKLHVAIWSVDGKKIFDSADTKPIEFTTGKSEVFIGLEQAAIGMSSGMRRNIIVPPSLQKTLHGGKSIIDFNLPKNQTVLVYIESIE